MSPLAPGSELPSSTPSVALVVQRYGTEVDGGSETLCRQVAERLADSASVEVLTTTALDYLTWKNEFPAGVTERRGVVVRRFPVASRRWVRSFGRLSERLYRTPHTIEDELDWMIRQGPRTPELLSYLKESRTRFDAFVFFTYLYYPTYFGLPLVAGKSVLVPTLHDEPPARFDIFRTLFWLPRAFVWNTPEERDLAREMFGIEDDGEVAGIGIDSPARQATDGFRRRHGLREFLLYVGRLDVWKGIPELLDHFGRYRAERAPELTLVLAGKRHMKLPAQAGVVPSVISRTGRRWRRSPRQPRPSSPLPSRACPSWRSRVGPSGRRSLPVRGAAPWSVSAPEAGLGSSTRPTRSFDRCSTGCARPRDESSGTRVDASCRSNARGIAS